MEITPAQARFEEKALLARRLTWLLAAGTAAGMGIFAFLFLRERTWQFLVETGILAAALALGLLSMWIYQNRNTLGGGLLLISAWLVAFGGSEIIRADMVLINFAGGSVITLLGSALILPHKRRLGWVLWLAYLGYLVGMNFWQPLTRYSIDQYPLLQSYLLGVLVLLAAGLTFVSLRALSFATIRTRLMLASLALVIVPVALLGMTSVQLVRQSAREQAEKELDTATAAAASRVGAWLSDMQLTLLNGLQHSTQQGHILTLLNTLPETAEHQAAYQAQAQLLDSLVAPNLFDNLFILDRRGTVVFSTGRSMEGRLFFNQPFYRDGLEGPTLQVDRIETGVSPVRFTLALPVVEGNRTLGVLAGQVGLREVRNILLDVMQNADDKVYLVGWDMMLLTPIQSEYVQVPVTHSGAGLLTSDKSAGMTDYRSFGGIDVVAAYRWLPVLNAGVIAERSETLINQSSNRIARLSGWATLLVSLIALGGALLLTRSISRPIAELDATARQIAAGDMNMRASTVRADEVGRLATSFNQMTDRMRSLIASLEDRVEERTQEVQRRSTQITAAAEVGKVISTIQRLDALLVQVTRLISDKFGYYHTGIFLLDERGEYAVLRAANSEGGLRMLARNHRLAPGTGIVGTVVRHGAARIALDVGDDAVYFSNPDLPDTHSEMALPLISGGEMLGVLDLQSTETGAFDREDIEVLQLVADQLAVAIQNARLFARTQEALDAAQKAYGMFSQRAWAERLKGQPEVVFHSDEHSTAKTGDAVNSESLRAMETGRMVRGNGSTHSLAIPIKVRDTVIGVVDTFKPLEAGTWTDEEVQAIEKMIDELGETLESARLYEETQVQAENERLTAEITRRMRATLDVEYVLQTAAQAMLNALELAEVEVRIDTPKARTVETGHDDDRHSA